jgi:hypothetical protein
VRRELGFALDQARIAHASDRRRVLHNSTPLTG